MILSPMYSAFVGVVLTRDLDAPCLAGLGRLDRPERLERGQFGPGEPVLPLGVPVEGVALDLEGRLAGGGKVDALLLLRRGCALRGVIARGRGGGSGPAEHVPDGRALGLGDGGGGRRLPERRQGQRSATLHMQRLEWDANRRTTDHRSISSDSDIDLWCQRSNGQNIA